MTEPSTPKRSFSVGTAGRLPCPQNHTEVAAGLPAAIRAAVDRMLAQNRRRAIHERAQALGALALWQMRFDRFAGDVVRGRQMVALGPPCQTIRWR